MESRLRVMSYNAHACVGTNGELSYLRIAEVIAAYDPDIVGLQELDLARQRSGGMDQAERIAADLKMHFHFHPALRIKEELYGDAILSKWPLRVRHAAELPTVAARLAFEPRGALWVSAIHGDQEVQIINTHLGLSRRERLAQAQALLGPGWLGDPSCVRPVILIGDFNALPNSAVHRLFCSVLRDAHRHAAPARRPTFPSRFPVLRLDYIFVSEDVEVLTVQVPRTPLTQLASDHLPVVVDLALPSVLEQGGVSIGEVTSGCAILTPDGQSASLALDDDATHQG